MSSSGPAADLPFQQLAQHLPMLCWISDADGVITWVNDAWMAYTGKGPGELAGDGLASLHDPAALPEVCRRWAVTKASGKPEEIVFPLRGRDGILRPFLTRVVPLPDAEGRISRWFGTNTDISDRTEAEARASRTEAELEENFTRLRLATEAGGVGVWEWRLQANEFLYSARAKAICGFPPDRSVTYEMVLSVTHPEDLPHTRAQAERALDPAIRDRAQYRYRIVRPTGEVRWVLASGEAVFEPGPEGEVATRYLGTLVDITEHQLTRGQLEESEARLRQSEEQLRLATEAAEIGLWDVDPVSDSLYWPPRVKAMFGISPDAPVSLAQDFFACLHPDDRDNVATAYSDASDPKRRALYDVEYRTIGKEDGVVRWVAAKGRGLFNAQGECYRVIGTAMDITGHKAAQQSARDQARSLEVLNATGAALAAELDLEKIVQAVTDAGVGITGAEFGAFFHNFANEASESYFYALSGVARSNFEAFPMPRNTAVFGPTFAGEGAIRSGDITADPRYGKNPPYHGIPKGHLPVRSYLAVPVTSRSGEVLGGLFFGHSEADRFTQAAEDLLAGVAGQAAVAIDNAQLYQAAQREIEQRRRSEAQQLLLINELNHRVKNTLATVQFIVAQTSRTNRSPAEIREVIEGRLLALSAAHDLLTRHSWEGADLRDVVQRGLAPFSQGPDGRVRAVGPSVPLSPPQALAISMAIYELATNAAKYGALSCSGGSVQVTWQTLRGRLELQWQEQDGPAVVVPSHRGFGSRMLERALAADLHGKVTLDFRPQGVRCAIVAPLSSARIVSEAASPPLV